MSTLVAKYHVIQSRFSNGTATKNTNISEMLQKQMIKGNVNDRLRPLTNNHSKGILPLDDITMNELHNKHPEASPTYDDVLIQGPIALVNEVIFDGIDKNEILRACLRTKGAAGVWGLDAEALQRILRSKIFGTAATDL